MDSNKTYTTNEQISKVNLLYRLNKTKRVEF